MIDRLYENRWALGYAAIICAAAALLAPEFAPILAPVVIAAVLGVVLLEYQNARMIGKMVNGK